MDTAEVNWDVELRTLESVRAAEKKLKAEAEEAWEKVQATEAYKAWDLCHQAVGEAKRQTDAFESVIRLAAVTQFKRTGEKQVAQGIVIRVVRKVSYSDTEALRYCLSGLAAALTFDRKVLDKTLLSLPPNLRPSFVEVSEEPQATIATDLSKALAAGLKEGEE